MILLLVLGTLWSVFESVCGRVDSLDQAKIIDTPHVSCSTKWATVSFKTSAPFQGRVFVEDMAFDSRCSAQYFSNLSPNATFRFPLRPCASIDRTGNDGSAFMATANIRITFHPVFMMENSDVIRVACADTGADGVFDEDGSANSICKHEVMRAKSDLAKDLVVGNTIYHKWSCGRGFDIAKHAMLLRNCDVSSRTRETIHLVDSNGCVVDGLLLSDLTYDSHKLEVTAESKLVKFIDDDELRFSCHVVLVPRPSTNAPVQLPKCQITKEELRRRLQQKMKLNLIYFEQSDQLYKNFGALMNDTNFTQTRTLTEWLSVKDNPNRTLNAKTVVLGKIDKGLSNEMIELQKHTEQDVLKPFMPNHLTKNKNGSRVLLTTTPSPVEPLPAGVNFGRTAVPFDKYVKFTESTYPPVSSQPMTTTTTTTRPSTASTEDSAEFSLRKIEELLRESGSRREPSGEDSEETPLSSLNNFVEQEFRDHDELPVDQRADWRFDDLILNMTDEVGINCASELGLPNGTNIKYLKTSALSCSWRTLNVALVLWSVGSAVVWLILSIIAFHKYLWNRSQSKRHHPVAILPGPPCLPWPQRPDDYGVNGRISSTYRANFS